MRLPLIVLALVLAAGGAAAAREVTRTYETPAAPCGPLLWCATGGWFWPLADGSLDVGLVTEDPQPGEARVSARVRDASGTPVIALLCQDLDENGGCDTGPASADRFAWMCAGTIPSTAIDAEPVHVLVPPPGARVSACAAPQSLTLTGTVVLTFE